MRDEWRENLTKDITRKQFLQYLAGAALMVFGMDNLLSLLTGGKIHRHVYLPQSGGDNSHGFGSSRFGV